MVEIAHASPRPSSSSLLCCLSPAATLPHFIIGELLLPVQLCPDAMARERGGDWDGSTVIEDHLTFLRAT